MTNFNVEAHFNNNKESVRFTSDRFDSVISIVMAVIGASPMWSEYTITITPEGAQTENVCFLTKGKKNIALETGTREKQSLRGELTAYFEKAVSQAA